MSGVLRYRAYVSDDGSLMCSVCAAEIRGATPEERDESWAELGGAGHIEAQYGECHYCGSNGIPWRRASQGGAR